MAEGDPIRIIPHRGIDDDCGSLEVWFADGRKSIRFQVSHRLSGNTLTREQAIEKAAALAQQLGLRSWTTLSEGPDNPQTS
jgi:hypothetical protein